MPESASEGTREAGRRRPDADLEPLDPIARRTKRLDLAASLLLGGTMAVFEMGGAIAKRGFDAEDGEVALLTSGQSLGLILSFFVAHHVARGRKMPLVFLPELARGLALTLVFFVKSTFALGFVLCHATAQMFQAMSVPARVTIYRLNLPSSLRGHVVGRNRQLQLLVAAVVVVLMSAALEWSLERPELVRALGPPPVTPGEMVRYVVPSIALLGFMGTFLFRAIPVRPSGEGEGGREPAEGAQSVEAVEGVAAPVARGSIADTFRAFIRVWREDREFRRYEMFFIVFGFANIMSIPLVQIHAVDELEADYFDLALINVVLVYGVMALTMGFWGKLVDRYPPASLRGVLNVIFAVDLLVLAVAPTIEWVYLGRVCRGIALGGGTLVWMLGSLYYARSPEKVPIYLGIHTVLTGLRWMAAPFVGVLLKALCRDNARPVFLLSFALVVLTGILMIRSERKRGRRQTHGGEPPMPAPRTPGA